MKVSRWLKLIVLVLTFWLPVYMVGFFALMFGAEPSEAGFHALMRVHFATMAVQAFLLVFYIVHLFKARSVASDKRALWGIAIFCGGLIAMPVYFFAHIWPETEA